MSNVSTSVRKSDLLASMRAEGLSRVNLNGARQVGVGTYQVPVEGGWVEITVTAKNPIGTLKVPAYDADAAVRKWEDTLTERERKAAERAARKAERAAKDND